jgi:hypothetical protein
VESSTQGERAVKARDESGNTGGTPRRHSAWNKSPLSKAVATIDLETGYPTADEARRRVEGELERARRQGIGILKLIHGYGSSGKGGKIRSAVRRALEQNNALGRVVFGEAWSIFDADSRFLMDRYPALRGDSDLEKGNPGITLVEVRARS